MAEKDIIANEMRRMQELDGVIATHLPNVKMDDPESVAQLQQLFNIKYPDSKDLEINGRLDPTTMSMLRVWLSKTQFLEDLDTGASNTVINPEAARAEGHANGYIPFQDDFLAQTVSSAAKSARGTEAVLDEVVGDITKGGLV